jgi:hypothetical protein
VRKTLDVTITAETAPSVDGRDYGKTFRITEMSALAAERWANRATLALAPRLSAELGEEAAEEIVENATMPSMGRIFRVLGRVSFPEMEPLLAELLACVQVVPDPKHPQVVRALNLGGMEDIEDVETLRYLRSEVMDLHVGFTMAATVLKSMAAIPQLFEPTLTSPSQSELSSPAPRPSPATPSSRRFTAART